MHAIASHQTDEERDQSQPHVAGVARGLAVVHSLQRAGVPAAKDENRQSGKNKWEIVIVHLLRR